MKELEIKRFLIQGLMPFSEITHLASEVRFMFGTRRADLVVVEGDLATVYEIKGAQDSPERLIEQLASYKQYFDYSYVVCEDQNLSQVRRYVSAFAGIITVSESGAIKYVRKAKKNAKLNKLALASTVGSSVLSKNFHYKGAKSKFEICTFVSDKYPLYKIKALSRSELYNKCKSVSDLFKRDVVSVVSGDDIKTLSISPPTNIY